MPQLNLEIFTPDKLSYSGEIKAIIVPGAVGAFQVLYNHAPLISTLEIGAIKVEVTDDKTIYFATGGGTIEVLNNKVKILADSLESISEINIERAKNAIARAQERIERKHIEKIDVPRAETALARANNRIRVYEKYFEYMSPSK